MFLYKQLRVVVVAYSSGVVVANVVTESLQVHVVLRCQSVVLESTEQSNLSETRWIAESMSRPADVG